MNESIAGPTPVHAGAADDAKPAAADTVRFDPNRRRLLFGGFLLAQGAKRTLGNPAPPTSQHWLVHRITMGLTTEELALADSLGYDGYLEHHLDPAAIDDSALDTRLAGYATLTMQPYELIPLTGGAVRNELIEATILRSVFSKRQLFERMVEFWTDHFNIDINNGNDQYFKTIDDRDVIRANALGTFPALLSASAHSPAMLFYLDNNTNTSGNPNENYARELMELHTLGVDGGYTQEDVQEVARCFTGWTLWGTGAGNNAWTFRFNSNTHDNAAKTVLGNPIAAGGGINDGLAVLDILVNHPSTAQFISRKLCRWFWDYEPPQSLVDSVAATYTSTGGDIKEMIRTLFASVDPLSAPLKYKRPYHLYVSAMRATGTAITATSSLRNQLAAAGHIPFYWGPPDGYPDALDAWVGLILPRWNFGASLMNGNINGCSVDINVLLSGTTTAVEVMDRIDTVMFGGVMDAAEKDRIRQYLLPDPPSTSRKREAVGLAIGSPGYQWY